MSGKKEHGLGRYFGEELEHEPKDQWDMVGLAIRLVLKTIVFLVFIIIKIIRGLMKMGLRGKLRRKKPQEVQSFAFNPQDAQQMAQAGHPVAVQQPMQYPQIPQPVPQSPIPQQSMQQLSVPLPPMPQQDIPMQPASSIPRLPVTAPTVDGMQIQMLNEIYGAIGYIRQALVDTQRIIGVINNSINDIYQRLNTIEGVQPVPTSRKKFEKKR